jgi:hypothetical protein
MSPLQQLASHAPQSPQAVVHLLEGIVHHPYAIRRLKPRANLTPLLIGIRTRDGVEWQIVCRICGWTSLEFTEKPARIRCEACADLAEGHSRLAALYRVTTGANAIGDVVVEG